MAGTTVVILGGGVAGMSAAHELAERGFRVRVFEQKQIPGGKARSIPKPGSGTDGRPNLPGEHGFRFFPRFYRHLPDTLKRIPYPGNAAGVFDNLVQTTRIDLTRNGLPAVQMLSRFPRSLEDLRVLVAELEGVKDGIGLRPGELSFFVERLWQLVTSCEARREDEYERIAWWDFIGASTRSDAYQKFLAEGLTRSLVAADAKVASARLEGDVGLQLFFDLGSPGVSADRVLNGPTNDVWIEPWLSHLRSLGVEYNLGYKLDLIHCANGSISGVDVLGPGGRQTVTADYYVVAVPLEVMARLLQQEQHQPILTADPGLAGIIPFSQCVAWMNGLQLYLRRDVPIVNGHAIYLDSPWAITTISQPQFWQPRFDLRNYGDGEVRGLISVDISNWNSNGLLHTKPAKACTRQEIMEEVWYQLKLALNVGGQELLHDDDLVTWFLDPDIHDLVGEERTRYEDAEPLMIATVNSWHLRPDAWTRIPNLFLASDYIRTYTQLATMEAANEAARRAVNGILDASGVRAPACELWRLHEPWVMTFWRWYDAWRYSRGLPWESEPPWLIKLAQSLLVRGFNFQHRLGRARARPQARPAGPLAQRAGATPPIPSSRS